MTAQLLVPAHGGCFTFAARAGAFTTPCAPKPHCTLAAARCQQAAVRAEGQAAGAAAFDREQGARGQERQLTDGCPMAAAPAPAAAGSPSLAASAAAAACATAWLAIHYMSLQPPQAHAAIQGGAGKLAAARACPGQRGHAICVPAQLLQLLAGGAAPHVHAGVGAGSGNQPRGEAAKGEGLQVSGWEEHG